MAFIHTQANTERGTVVATYLDVKTEADLLLLTGMVDGDKAKTSGKLNALDGLGADFVYNTVGGWVKNVVATGDMAKSVYDTNDNGAVDLSDASTKLATARNINGVPFDGTVDINIPVGGFLTLEDFGAVGDGVADDTVALQNAFDSLTTNQTLYGTFGKTYRTTKLNLINSNWIYDGRMSTIFVDTVGGADGSAPESALIDWDSTVISDITFKNTHIDSKHHLDDLYYNFIRTGTNSPVITRLKLLNVYAKNLHAVIVGRQTPIGNYSLVDCLLKDCYMTTDFTVPVGSYQDTTRVGSFFNVGSTNGMRAVNVQVDKTFGLGLYAYSDNGTQYLNHGGITSFENCRAYDTIDTCLYTYADGTIFSNNRIKNAGKDGIKVNGYSGLSKNAKIYGNVLYGKAGQHASDGGNFMVVNGDGCDVYSNTIDCRGVLEYDKGGTGMAISGKVKVHSNTIKGDETFRGMAVYQLNFGAQANDITDGAEVYDNYIDTIGGECIFLDSGHKNTSVTSNKLYTNNIAVNISGTTNVPYFHTIKYNKITGRSIATAQAFSTYSGDRITFVGNELFGEFQREINNSPANTRGFVGHGNVSYAKVSNVAFAIQPRGANYNSLPTQGTFYQGEKIGSKTQGYLCLTRGTYGTPTATTATTTTGSSTITIDAQNVYRGQVITLVGESGDFLIVDDSLDGLTLTLDRNCANIASVAVGFQAPTFSVASPFYV